MVSSFSILLKVIIIMFKMFAKSQEHSGLIYFNINKDKMTYLYLTRISIVNPEVTIKTHQFTYN